MELHIDLNSPKEIVFGLNLLNSLAMAVRAQQEAELGAAAQAQVQQASQQVAPAAPVHAHAHNDPARVYAAEPIVTERVVRETTEVGDARHTTEVVTKKSAPVAAAVTADAGPKRRGRPPKSAKQHAAVAADQPVGAVLAGVPARDLAAALQAPVEHEVTSDELGDALADERAAEEAIESAVSTEDDDVVVHTDPDTPAEDTAALKADLEAGDEPDDLSFEKELFGASAGHEPAPPVDDPYADKSDHDLYIMWRKEAGDRPIHWGRAIVKKYNIRGEEDMTREILLEALLHPEQYMPPAVV